jgi:hypothetical protein
MGTHEKTRGIPRADVIHLEPARLRGTAARLGVVLATVTLIVAAFAAGPPFLRVTAIFVAVAVAVGLVADAGTRDFERHA